MAQSVNKPAKSQHAGKSRKVSVIDLEPINKSTREAEPVAIDAKQESPMSQSTDNKAKVMAPNSAIGDENKPSSDNGRSKLAGGSERKETAKVGSWRFIVSGCLGGIIALIVGAGLQWAGVLPSLSSESALQNKLTMLEEEIGGLKQKIANDVVATTELSKDDRKSLDGVVEAVGGLNAKTGEIGRQLADVTTNVETLNNLVNAMGAQNGNPQALDSLAKRFSGVDQKLSLLDGIEKKASEALDLGTKNTDDINALTQQFNEMKAGFSHSVQGQEIAVMAAVNSLKNAIDRGGSYANELKVLQSVAPDLKIFDKLQKNASKGLANQAELAHDFSFIADKIAATENQPPEGSGVSERLWAGAKGLVSSRPIGNVEGDNPAAIAARMEVAIQAGDYEKALGEWQNLPQNAKDISASFVQKLILKRDVDSLLSDVMAMVAQPSAPKNK